MSRTRKQDCWQASVRISIPIDATKPETIAAAQNKVRDLAALIPGSAVEITHAGFGRMAAAAITGESPGLMVRLPDGGTVPFSSLGATDRDVLPPVTPRPLPPVAQADQPEIPTFLRRNGGDTEAGAA